MAIVSVIATRGGIARAECAPESAHFEPNDGAALPPDPTIYFFTGHDTEAAPAITASRALSNWTS